MSYRLLSVLSLAFAVCHAVFAVGDAFANPARVAAHTVRAAAGKSLPARAHTHGMPSRVHENGFGSVRLSERQADQILGKKSDPALKATDLVDMCEGDSAAAKRVSDVAYAKARFHVHRYSLRDDVAQKALFKLLNNCAKLVASPPPYPTTFVSTLVERTWIDMLRADGRYGFHLEKYELLVNIKTNSYVSMEDINNRARAKQALEYMMKRNALTDRQSEVLLQSIMGFSQEETAENLGISRPLVQQELAKVRVRAQKVFAE